MRRLLSLPLPAALPAVLATAVLLAACGGGDDDSMDMNHDDAGTRPVTPGAREIEVEATSFEFGPAEIDVRAGEDVAIVLSADDVEHDFVIEELRTHISADPGETAEGGLRVDEPGRYTFYCSVSGHREAGMEGTLVVS